MEDLKILNMTRSAKGTIENPGRNVKAKAGLKRVILDQGLKFFATILEQKMQRGIYPKYTSQRCSTCEHTSKENRKSQACFVCKS